MLRSLRQLSHDVRGAAPRRSLHDCMLAAPPPPSRPGLSLRGRHAWHMHGIHAAMRPCATHGARTCTQLGMLAGADLDVGVGVKRLVGVPNPLDFHRSFVSRNKPVLVEGLLLSHSVMSVQKHASALQDEADILPLLVFMTSHNTGDCLQLLCRGLVSLCQVPCRRYRPLAGSDTVDGRAFAGSRRRLQRVSRHHAERPGRCSDAARGRRRRCRATAVLLPAARAAHAVLGVPDTFAAPGCAASASGASIAQVTAQSGLPLQHVMTARPLLPTAARQAHTNMLTPAPAAGALTMPGRAMGNVIIS